VILHISHGARGFEPDDVDWFVVHPLKGKTERSIVDTPITHEMALESLLRAGRVVFELDLTNMTVTQKVR
jgi:hypothetical protein